MKQTVNGALAYLPMAEMERFLDVPAGVRVRAMWVDQVSASLVVRFEGKGLPAVSAGEAFTRLPLEVVKRAQLADDDALPAEKSHEEVVRIHPLWPDGLL